MKKVFSADANSMVFFDGHYNVVAMPTLWSCILRKTGISYRLLKVKTINISNVFERRFEEETIGPKTIGEKERYLLNFLKYLEIKSGDGASHDCLSLSNEELNKYINEYLVNDQQSSNIVAEQVISSLRSFYDFFAYHNLCNTKNIFITAQSLSKARQQVKKNEALPYISLPLFSEMLQRCSTLRDGLLLRSGRELGLRAKECTGLLLHDQNINGLIKPGLLTLFNEMKCNPKKTEFQYHLQGIHSKGLRGQGGRSRMLFIARTLLQDFERYYLTERSSTSSANCFFLTRKHPITPRTPSDLFRSIKKELLSDIQTCTSDLADHQIIEKGHRYHLLRHSFGTDLFIKTCRDERIRFDDVRPTSSAYLYVAKRMGHSTKSSKGFGTTVSYIHGAHIAEKLNKCQ